MHEFVAVEVFQYGACAAHGFGDEEGGFLGGVVQAGGVELHEFEVAEHSASAMHHGYAVAGGDDGRGGGGVDVAHAAGGQEGHFREVGVDAVGVAVEGVDAVALDVGGVFGDALPEVVLGDDVDGELAFFDFDVGVAACRFEQAALDFFAGVVLVVEDAEFGVAAFTVQVEAVAVLVEVEVDAVLHQFADPVGSLADGHLDHLAVADAVAGHQGVLDMLVERVAVVHHRCDAALGIAGGSFRSVAFGQYAHFAIGGHLEGKTESGDAGTHH